MRYVYPCDIVLDEEEKSATGREAYTVTFPDVYGATTGGWSWEEALENAGGRTCRRPGISLLL